MRVSGGHDSQRRQKDVPSVCRPIFARRPKLADRRFSSDARSERSYRRTHRSRHRTAGAAQDGFLCYGCFFSCWLNQLMIVCSHVRYFFKRTGLRNFSEIDLNVAQGMGKEDRGCPISCVLIKETFPPVSSFGAISITMTRPKRFTGSTERKEVSR